MQSFLTKNSNRKKFLILSLFLFFLPLLVIGENENNGLDNQINEIVEPITSVIYNVVFYPWIYGERDYNATKMPFVIILLLVAATIFTFYFKFINFRSFKLAFRTIKGKYTAANAPGEITHFQALTSAVSGTVGLGNISGVAIAITIGGPGATFWMIIAGFLGMASKFAECTLGVKYRNIDANQKVYGGPMHYLTKGLEEKGFKKSGKILAIFFAIMCIGGSFGGGNMFQANQAAQQFINQTGITTLYAGTLFGVVMAFLVGLVIIGGIERIGKVTEKIVPLMVGIYLLAALVIIALNLPSLPLAIGKIVTEAFAPVAVGGGFMGVLIQGFRRGAFSNEAGVGSASIAHAAVKTNYPASEGIVALLEPFIDTVVVCTITALVVIITGEYLNADGMAGVEITSNAFGSVLPWFPNILTVAVILFAFSTMITWSYYGQQCWVYLFNKSKLATTTYKVLFCLFIIIGSAANLSAVTDFSDAMIFAMSVPNLIGLLILMPMVKSEVKKFKAHVNRIEQ